MFYGGLGLKETRTYRKHYSADGSMEIKENTQTGAIEFVTYIGGDGYSAPVVYKKAYSSVGAIQEQTLYLHRDYQGSILAITNETGAILEKRQFDAWGAIVKVQDGAGTILNGLTILDRGYTGHEHLQSVGLIHMNGRLYDPKLHRFLQPDNYVQDPENTQNYNRYGYVLNNPLKYTDPSGEFKINWNDIIAGVAIVAGAILSYIPGLAVIGVPLIGAGVAHFGATYAEYTKTGDWNAASNNAGINFGATVTTDFGYDDFKNHIPGVIQNDPVVSSISGGNGVGTNSVQGPSDRAKEIMLRYRTKYEFYGANLKLDAFKYGSDTYNSTLFGTIHTSVEFYNDYQKNGLDSKGGLLLIHEYGHYLHAQTAPLNFYSYAMWSSIATASSPSASSNWTEIRANTMAYYYFGQPKYKYWDPKKYPIDSNYLSKQEIYNLTHHLKPFNP